MAEVQQTSKSKKKIYLAEPGKFPRWRAAMTNTFKSRPLNRGIFEGTIVITEKIPEPVGDFHARLNVECEMIGELMRLIPGEYLIYNIELTRFTAMWTRLTKFKTGRFAES
jgi:hypothetical protein